MPDGFEAELSRLRALHARLSRIVHSPQSRPFPEAVILAELRGERRPAAQITTPAAIQAAPALTLATIRRLRLAADPCPYADAPAFRPCGCRVCWWHGRDVGLRECLDCAGGMVGLG